MGIKDLPRQLKEDKRFVTEVDPQQLKDKTLGVDAFVWLHRVVSKASNDVDYCRQFHAKQQVLLLYVTIVKKSPGLGL